MGEWGEILTVSVMELVPVVRVMVSWIGADGVGTKHEQALLTREAGNVVGSQGG